MRHRRAVVSDRTIASFKPRSGGGALVALLFAALCSGCGHPATREECDAIFEKSAEVELRAQNVSDPAQIADRIKEAREARGNELMAKCLGKRITDSAVACVRAATTSEQIDRCLD